MKSTLLGIAVGLCVSPVFAGEKSFSTTKDGAGYEATLRRVGIPQSGGMVWPVLASKQSPAPAPAPAPTITLATSKQ